MKLIQTITVGAGGASGINFTSIPQTYTDLVLHLSCNRTSDTGSGAGALKFNSNSSNYAVKVLYGNGSSTGATSSSGATYAYVFEVGNLSNSGFTSSYFYIPNYTSSSNKTLSCESTTETNGTTAYLLLSNGFWSNSSAITEINLSLLGSGNFSQYSTASLYGITKGSGGATAS